MATVAEDFAYFLVNPTFPYFAEEMKLYNFWGLDDVVSTMAEANLLNHADVVALGVPARHNAAAIWALLRNQTFYGITFREFTNVDAVEPARKMYVAVKE